VFKNEFYFIITFKTNNIIIFDFSEIKYEKNYNILFSYKQLVVSSYKKTKMQLYYYNFVDKIVVL